MKAVLTFLRSYPAYVTGFVQGAVATAVLLGWVGPNGKYVSVSTDQLVGVQSFILFVLLGWVHQEVTPAVRLKK